MHQSSSMSNKELRAAIRETFGMMRATNDGECREALYSQLLDLMKLQKWRSQIITMNGADCIAVMSNGPDSNRT